MTTTNRVTSSTAAIGGEPHIRTKYEDITPAMALEYLKTNLKNRSIRQKAVDEYATEMRAGRWITTHQGIAFFEDGELADGQHRLLAIVQSGCTIKMAVTRGLPKEVADSEMVTGDVIDMGRARTTADQLARSHGITNQNLYTACLRVIASICAPSIANNRLTPGMALAIQHHFRNEIEYMIQALSGFKPARRAPVIGTLAFCARVFPTEVNDFVEKFVSGVNLQAGSPELALRDHLTGLLSRGNRASMQVVIEQVANVIWNRLRGHGLSQVKRGQQGVEFFRNKQKPTVEKVRRAVLDIN